MPKRKQLIIATALAAALVGAGAPALCDESKWDVVGTVKRVLQNKTFWLGQQIDEVDLLTNSNTRLRVHSNGMFQVNPRSDLIGGFIIGAAGQAQYSTFQIQGGNYSGLASMAGHNYDWGQNIQSVVLRPKTVSYVVNWNGSDRFYVAGYGWLYAQGSYFPSDKRLKTDIITVDHALDKVLQMRGVSYRRIPEAVCDGCPPGTISDDENAPELGVIAQEVVGVVPEVVRTMPDGTQAVAYPNLVALLIEAIKEQQVQLDEQGDMIERLQRQVAR